MTELQIEQVDPLDSFLDEENEGTQNKMRSLTLSKIYQND